jgi:hypothetical protein
MTLGLLNVAADSTVPDLSPDFFAVPFIRAVVSRILTWGLAGAMLTIVVSSAVLALKGRVSVRVRVRAGSVFLYAIVALAALTVLTVLFALTTGLDSGGHWLA